MTDTLAYQRHHHLIPVRSQPGMGVASAVSGPTAAAEQSWAKGCTRERQRVARGRQFDLA